MDKPSFVYTTYIQTTPERLWQALTEPAFTERYWGVTFETDWQPGSTDDLGACVGVTIADPEQVVLESDPFRRLSYTLAHLHARAGRVARPDRARRAARLAAEPRSKVTFDLEPVGELVKLTVRPRRLRAGRACIALAGQQRLAARPVQPQDAARDRRAAAGQPPSRRPPRGSG